MRNEPEARKGFTLIEILLVLVIIAGLATVLIVMLAPAREGANIDLTKTRMEKIRSALQRYYTDLNEFPSEDQNGLEALVKKPTYDTEEKGQKWRGPYLPDSDALKDAWGREFTYEVVEDDSSGRMIKQARLTSAGPDGEQGTDDDIRSWKEDTGG